MDFTLLTDYYGSISRQGPGSDAATLRALELSDCQHIHGDKLRIVDMGCGTGAATRVLAKALPHAHILAVDFLEAFLRRLESDISMHEDAADIAPRVSTLHANMATHAFAPDSFHMIWSEGAIYNIGFEAGIAAWRPLLKEKGLLVLSEITWLTHKRPQELQSYWDNIYPEIDSAAGKIRQLEAQGYMVKGYFPLAPACWTENYYAPQARIQEAFLARHARNDMARALVEEQREEAALYARFHEFYGYGVYVAQRCE